MPVRSGKRQNIAMLVAVMLQDAVTHILQADVSGHHVAVLWSNEVGKPEILQHSHGMQSD